MIYHEVSFASAWSPGKETELGIKLQYVASIVSIVSACFVCAQKQYASLLAIKSGDNGDKLTKMGFLLSFVCLRPKETLRIQRLN
jgi:hypothetical protein